MSDAHETTSILDEALYSPAEMARWLSVSVRTVDRLLHDGRVPFLRVGPQRRVQGTVLRRLVAEGLPLPAKPPAQPAPAAPPPARAQAAPARKAVPRRGITPRRSAM